MFFKVSDRVTFLAWDFWITVVKEIPQNVETRLSLASLLCDCGRQNEAIALLVPPDSGMSRTLLRFATLI